MMILLFKRLGITGWGMVLCLSLIWASNAGAQKNRGRITNILILHSYHQGLKWTDSISKGVESELADLTDEIELHYEYLDTKRNTGDQYFDNLVAFKRYKAGLNQIRFSLIICSDNNALRFIQEHGETFYPGVPVVFCGVNNYTPALVDGIGQVTGVAESIDYKGTLALISRIHPERNNIVVILDRTPTGAAIKTEFETVAGGFSNRFTFSFLQDFLLDEIPYLISKLGKNDLIYLLALNRDRAGFFISYTDGIRMIREASRVPVYGSWDFYFGNGIVGGMITSGFAQGKEAAKKARQILSGVRASDIPVQTRSPNLAMFDYRELKAFGIKRSQLPDNCQIIHEPPGIFETYKRLIIGILLSVPAVSVILIWRLIVIKRRQIALKQLNRELDRRVAEQTGILKQKNLDLKSEIAERIKLEKEIRKLASTDSLTGISNRRSFIERANAEFQRSLRYQYDLSVVMMDIDHFKSINDTYGHQVGDTCLKTFTQTCQKVLRKNDLFGRLGGEEFCILLVETDPDEATRVAERLRRIVADTEMCEGKACFNFYVSIGVTGLTGADTDMDTAIQRADKALYQAKNNGRNQVAVLP